MRFCPRCPCLYWPVQRPHGRPTITASAFLINLFGAIGLLLWGMRMARTGVQRAFGGDLRALIGNSVSNRFKALGVGIVVTGLLQSSTATALMVASFAGRGLMATAPALAVMLGADIGTTIVAQVLSFGLAWLSPVLIGVGFVVHASASRIRPRQLGRAAIGLGLMLLALSLIVSGSEPLQESDILRDVFQSILGEPIIAVLLAALLTWLAHSSLAVVLLIMALVQAGTVPLDVAFALVLGANLGGTLPPVLATVAAGPVARRVPIGNALFKLIGVLAVLPMLGAVQPLVAAIDADAARQVVNFHTAFNVALAMAFIGLTDVAAKFCDRHLPAIPDDDDLGQPRHLDRGCLDSPSVALAAAARESMRVGDIVESMLKDSIGALEADDPPLARNIMERDDAVDSLHEAIKFYITEISRGEMDAQESRRAAQILTFTTDLEHIGDIVENLMDLAEKKVGQGVKFSDAGIVDLREIHRRVSENLQLALGVFMSADTGMAHRLIDQKRAIKDLEAACAQRHMDRLREGRRESIETSALHMDILRDLKRIHSHIVAIAYPVLDQAGELPQSRKPKAPETSPA